MRHLSELIRFILVVLLRRNCLASDMSTSALAQGGRMRVLRRLIFPVLVAAGALPGPSLAAAAQFGTGSVLLDETIDSGKKPWVTVDISKIDFGGQTPIIVAGPVTHENDQSMSVRVRNVTATEFEVALTSPCDSSNVDPNEGDFDCPPRKGNSVNSKTDWQNETVR